MLCPVIFKVTYMHLREALRYQCELAVRRGRKARGPPLRQPGYRTELKEVNDETHNLGAQGCPCHGRNDSGCRYTSVYSDLTTTRGGCNAMIPRLNQIFRDTIEKIKAALNALLWYREGPRPSFTDIIRGYTAATKIRPRVTTFMTTHGIPGASVAIAYKGQLVFSEGYGFADTSTNDPVTTNHLFRIASLSKPITSVAVFKLHQQQTLGLDEKVFGQGGVLGTTYGTPIDPNINQITVQHLLEHTSGWSNAATDIMLKADPNISSGTWSNMSKADLIKWMVANRPLAHTPGSTWEYLNFGYLVLGRVIEARSGMSYADYVLQEVLTPCGISDMHIAGNTLADRRPNEVHYYLGPGSTWNPYSILVSRMDAHGGWIASPTDLLRFLVRVDNFPTPPDILTSSSITTMVTPTPIGDNYAKGWAVHTTVPAGQDNYWHEGELPGTVTFFLRTTDQYCWAVLANSRHDATDATLNQMRTDIDRLFWDIMNDVEGGKSPDLVWPTGTKL
jgi:CubicO group peptidase (beta-lactamase class C family)